jgi:hypothetical protein
MFRVKIGELNHALGRTMFIILITIQTITGVLLEIITLFELVDHQLTAEL